MKIVHDKPYDQVRAEHYPDVREFIDAYYHKQRGTKPEAMEAYLAKCDAVKKRFPKPKDQV